MDVVIQIEMGLVERLARLACNPNKAPWAKCEQVRSDLFYGGNSGYHFLVDRQLAFVPKIDQRFCFLAVSHDVSGEMDRLALLVPRNIK